MVVPFDPGGTRTMPLTRRNSLSVALELEAPSIHGKERVLHSTSRATHNFGLKLGSSSRHGSVSTCLINRTSMSVGVSTGPISRTSISGGVSRGLIDRIPISLSPQLPRLHAAFALRSPAKSCDHQFPLCRTSLQLESLRPGPHSVEFRCFPTHHQGSLIPHSLIAKSTQGSSVCRNVECGDNQFLLCSTSVQLESLHPRPQSHEFGCFLAHHQGSFIPNFLIARFTYGSSFCRDGFFSLPHCHLHPQDYMLLTHISVPSGLKRGPFFARIQSIGQHVIDVPCLSGSSWSCCSHAVDVLMLKSSCINMIYLFIKCHPLRISNCCVKQLCDVFSNGTRGEFPAVFQSLFATVPAFTKLFTVVATTRRQIQATASTSFTPNLLSNEDCSEAITRQIYCPQSGKHTVYRSEIDAIARWLLTSTHRSLRRIERDMSNLKKATIASNAVFNWTPTIVLDQKSIQEKALVNKKHCPIRGFPEQKLSQESLRKHVSSVFLRMECCKPELQRILPNVELATSSSHKQIGPLAFAGEQAFSGFLEPSSWSSMSLGMIIVMDNADQCNNSLIDQPNVDEYSTKLSVDAQQQVTFEPQWKHSEHQRHLTMSYDRRNIDKFERYAEVFLLQRRVAQLQRRAQLNPPFPPVTSMARCTMLATCHEGIPCVTWSSPPTNQMSSVIVKEGAGAPAVMTWSSLPTIQMSSITSDKVQGGVNNWEKGDVVIDMSRFLNDTVIDIDNLWPCSGQSGSLLSSKSRTPSLTSLKSCTVSAVLFVMVAMLMYLRILLAGALNKTKRLQQLK